MSERELTESVDLCTPDGRLNPSAVGFSRRPLHRCNVSGHWPRKKRWDYWCITTPDHLIALTYADVDYLGLVDLWFFDFASGRQHHHPGAIPFAPGFSHSLHVNEAQVDVDLLGLRLSFHDEPGGTRLRFRSRRLGRERLAGEIFVALPEDHETLNVVVPWSEERFQFTSKHQARPAQGELVLDGRTYRFDEGAYGCLDFGRGVWPYRTTWNWASASGVTDGRSVGLNLGGQWTDGTGSTENGLVVDGRLFKISEDLELTYDDQRFSDPWTLRTRSGSVDLRFVPFHERSANLNLGILRSEVHQCFGHFEGRVRAGDETIAFDRLLGWAEEHRARW